jgi:hypothetical protein
MCANLGSIETTKKKVELDFEKAGALLLTHYIIILSGFRQQKETGTVALRRASYEEMPVLPTEILNFIRAAGKCFLEVDLGFYPVNLLTSSTDFESAQREATADDMLAWS